MQSLFGGYVFIVFESPVYGEQTACAKRERSCQSRSYSREEVSDRHGGAGLVASLHSAMFAESDIESFVNGRLVGIIVIWQQALLELALVFKGGLKRKERKPDQKHGRWKIYTKVTYKMKHAALPLHEHSFLSLSSY